MAPVNILTLNLEITIPTLIARIHALQQGHSMFQAEAVVAMDQALVIRFRVQ